MAPVVQVDKKFNISLKSVKDVLKIQPNDTFLSSGKIPRPSSWKKPLRVIRSLKQRKNRHISAIKKGLTLLFWKMNCGQHEGHGWFKHPYLFHYCWNAGISFWPKRNCWHWLIRDIPLQSIRSTFPRWVTNSGKFSRKKSHARTKKRLHSRFLKIFSCW